jgi:hypothetical protein
MINLKMKVGIILVLAILLTLMPITVDADIAHYLPAESLTSAEISIKESEGWELSTLGINVYLFMTSLQGWDTQTNLPTVNEPSTLLIKTSYSLRKHKGEDTFILQEACADEPVYLDIYKNDAVVDSYIIRADSEGKGAFSVTFREPGYYAYKLYTKWQKENGKIREDTHKFYVKPKSTPAPIPVTPPSILTPSTPTPTTTPTVSPLLSPTPTSIPTTTIPAFQIIPATVALLALAYLLRRRK